MMTEEIYITSLSCSCYQIVRESDTPSETFEALWGIMHNGEDPGAIYVYCPMHDWRYISRFLSPHGHSFIMPQMYAMILQQSQN
jgi:hypothetical protein